MAEQAEVLYLRGRVVLGAQQIRHALPVVSTGQTSVFTPLTAKRSCVDLTERCVNLSVTGCVASYLQRGERERADSQRPDSHRYTAPGSALRGEADPTDW